MSIPAAIPVLFGFAFTVATCMALGKLALRSLSLRLYRQEEHVFALVIGASLLSLLVFGFAAAGIARWEVFLATGLAAMGVAVRRSAYKSEAESLPPLPAFWKALFTLVFAVFTVLYFFNAMAPEVSPDGSGYHLGAVARYWREHGLAKITTNMFANLSQALEMLFLFAFAFGRHSSAALVHLAFLMTLPLAMLSYARRIGFAKVGVFAALLVYASPVVGVDGSSAYNDVAAACALFTLFYLLQIWAQTGEGGLLILIGLAAGFGYGLKYTAGVGIPYAVAVVGWKSRRWRDTGIVAACALLLVVPWIAKNWIWLGNPLSPAFNAVFPNPYVHVSMERQFREYAVHLSPIRSRWAVPWQATVRGELEGLIGPIFLLAPLALLALRRPAGRQLLLAAAVCGLGAVSNVSTRYLIPCLPYVSLAMGLALAEHAALLALLAMAHAVASWPSVRNKYCSPGAWVLRGIPVRAALRLQPEESFLQNRLHDYAAIQLIEQNVPAGSKVFVMNTIPESYTSREILVRWTSASNEVAWQILQAPVGEDTEPTQRRRFRFPPQKVRRLRVIQTASGTDSWSVSEFRVLHEGLELPRAEWRLRAHPNSWDAQLAVDDSPVTRWSSWQALFPGMFLEVDLGAPRLADEALLETTPDQNAVRVRLEGELEDGAWKNLAGDPGTFDVAPAPDPVLRRETAAELERRGIGYVLIADGEWQDFSDHALDWMDLVEKKNRYNLYRFRKSAP